MQLLTDGEAEHRQVCLAQFCSYSAAALSSSYDRRPTLQLETTHTSLDTLEKPSPSPYGPAHRHQLYLIKAEPDVVLSLCSVLTETRLLSRRDRDV
jgi:hypothetical protein